MVLFDHAVFGVGAVPIAAFEQLRGTPLRALVEARPAVLLFFVLSGFVLAAALRDMPLSAAAFLRFAAQRSLRLVPPALASAVLSAVLYRLAFSPPWPDETEWMRGASWSAWPSWGRVAAEGGLLRNGDINLVLWSLVIEWRLSLAVPLMVWWTRFRWPSGGAGLLFIGLALFGLGGGSTPELVGLSPSFAAQGQALLYFVLPFAAGVLLERTGWAARPFPAGLAWAALAAAAGLARAPSELATIVAATLVVWLVQQPTAVRAVLRWPALTWIGRLAFSLYLVHLPVIDAVHHGLHDAVPLAGLVMLSVLGALVAAWVFYHSVERPSHAMARRIRLRPSVGLR